MHLIDTHLGTAARLKAEERPPLGAGFSLSLLPKIERLEVWGSSMKDEGPDFCEFHAFDKKNHPLDTIRVDGY